MYLLKYKHMVKCFAKLEPYEVTFAYQPEQSFRVQEMKKQKKNWKNNNKQKGKVPIPEQLISKKNQNLLLLCIKKIFYIHQNKLTSRSLS